MALLFDEAQGAFQDTGSKTSPTKKQTGLMRKQMNKMDEAAPRGHTLAYITPEEAQILNKGGGGIDEQGNQMTGPYGIPMYSPRGRRGRSSTPRPGAGASGPPGRNYSTGGGNQGKSRGGGGRSGQGKSRGGGGQDKSILSTPSGINRPGAKDTSKSAKDFAKTYSSTKGSPFVDRQRTTQELNKLIKKDIPSTTYDRHPDKPEGWHPGVGRDKSGYLSTHPLRSGSKGDVTTTGDEETPSSGDYLKEWWRKREQEKKLLLPVEKPEIRIAEFDVNKFNQKLGSMIGGWGGGFIANPNILGNLGLTAGNKINEILTDKEKGVGILNWKGGVSKEIIEFLQENAPENEAQRQQMINILNKLPQNVQDNLKKAVDEGELSFDVVSIKPFGVDGVTKLASGDLILDKLPDEFQVASTGSLRGLL